MLDCFTDCVAETLADVNVIPVVTVEDLVVAELKVSYQLVCCR